MYVLYQHSNTHCHSRMRYEHLISLRPAVVAENINNPGIILGKSLYISAMLNIFLE